VTGVGLRLPDRVTVLNAASTIDDGQGNLVPDWAHAVEKREQALVEPLTAEEYTAARDTIVSRYKLMLHAKTAATGTSRIVWRGSTFEIAGEVQLTTSVSGRPDHREAFMETAQL